MLLLGFKGTIRDYSCDLLPMPRPVPVILILMFLQYIIILNKMQIFIYILHKWNNCSCKQEQEEFVHKKKLKEQVHFSFL